MDMSKELNFNFSILIFSFCNIHNVTATMKTMLNSTLIKHFTISKYYFKTELILDYKSYF